jgi:hypothetical protein
MDRNKELTHKVKAGMKDERQAITYYKGFTKSQLEQMTKKERQNLRDAERDEKEHLKYLEKDKKTLLGKRNR